MKPLVLVHGFMGGSAQWHLQEPLGRDRPLITVDLPGFGDNSHLDPLDRIEGFAAWVIDDLDRQGVERFDLLGHSMGGMIVQEITHLAPERVADLILYATGSKGVMPGRFETIGDSMQRARSDGAQATARRIAATWFLDGENHPEFEGCAAVAEKSSLGAILAGLDALKAWSGESRLSAINQETLIMWGDQDRSYAWPQIEIMWRRIPSCSLSVLPRCAHAAHAEEPQLFNGILTRFLERSCQSEAHQLR